MIEIYSKEESIKLITRCKLSLYDEVVIGNDALKSYGHDDKDVTEEHCCVQLMEDSWWFTPLGSNCECYRKVREERCEVEVGDAIYAGSYSLELKKVGEKKTEWELKRVRFEESEKSDEEESKEENAKDVTSNNNKVFQITRSYIEIQTGHNDDKMSGEHCEIRYERKKLYVNDGFIGDEGKVKRPSTNGTLIKLQQKTYALPHSTILDIGSSTSVSLSK